MVLTTDRSRRMPRLYSTKLWWIQLGTALSAARRHHPCESMTNTRRSPELTRRPDAPRMQRHRDGIPGGLCVPLSPSKQGALDLPNKKPD